jgi:hypothetical protein
VHRLSYRQLQFNLAPNIKNPNILSAGNQYHPHVVPAVHNVEPVDSVSVMARAPWGQSLNLAWLQIQRKVPRNTAYERRPSLNQSASSLARGSDGQRESSTTSRATEPPDERELAEGRQHNPQSPQPSDLTQRALHTTAAATKLQIFIVRGQSKSQQDVEQAVT